MDDKNEYINGWPASRVNEFIQNWRVAAHQPDTASGFSATVFERINPQPGESRYVFAARGTAGIVDIVEDVSNLVANGLAWEQTIDMYNWWQELTTPLGETYQRASAVMADGSQSSLPNTVIEKEQVWRIDLTSTMQNQTPRLAADTKVDVTGHSLGGHLATAFSRLFTDNTNSVVTVNGAGYSVLGQPTGNIQRVFATLGGQPTFPADRILNIYGDRGPEIVTQDFSLRQPGDHQMALLEDWSLDNTLGHGATQMSQSLVLYDTLRTLQNGGSSMSATAMLSTFSEFLRTGSNDQYQDYEGLLDQFRYIVLGDTGKTAIGDAESFHARLNNLRDSSTFQALAGKATIAPASNTANLQTQARTDFGTFLALYTLSPVVISTSDAAALNALKGAHASLAAAWQADQTAASPSTFTDQYLTDRANMLAALMQRNGADSTNDNLRGTAADYIDRQSGTTLLVGSSAAVKPLVIFGSDSAETDLAGGSGSDRIYGGAGNDTLEGKGGSDRLEGGAGNDTYVLSASDNGVDTIFDSDGQGQIKVGDTVVAGSFSPRAEAQSGAYYSSDFAYKLSRMGGGSTRGDWRLFVKTTGSNYREVAQLQNWQSGELGLDINGAPLQDPTPTAGLSFPNSSAYLNFNASQSNQGVILESGDRSSSFTGSAYSDLIFTGNGSGNYVMAQGGNDIILGGSGREYIRAGANGAAVTNDDDSVEAGEDTDMVYGGAGNDDIWGNTQDTEYLVTQSDSGAWGDWLSGEGGDDRVYGSRGKDMIFGGAGNDQLVGGAGDDLILGDAMYTVSSRAIALPYSNSLPATLSYVWKADGSVGSALNQYDYGLHPVMVPDGNIHHWTWSATESDYSINLASGIPFLSQVRVAPQGGNDIIDGGEGNDWIAGQTGDDTIDGGAGDDVIYGDDAVALPEGSAEGNDKLYAGAGKDVLYGGGGNDELNAQDDDNELDKLYGGAGDDILSGGTGHDELHGGDDNDQLFAGSDGSAMHGGTGNDVYVGGAGNDTLHDVAGDDVYHTSGGGDSIMDLDGDDTYYINRASLQAGSVTTITDVDGVGALYFDGALLTAKHVKALSKDQWQSTDGQSLLTRQDNDLVIASTEASITGTVLVKNFFGQGEFLGLALPAYQEPEPVNRAPVLGSAIGARSVDEDSAWSWTLAPDAFSDPDGDVLTYSARLADGGALPAWLAFDAGTRTFSGTPVNGDVGSVQVQVSVTDGKGGTASQVFALEVLNVNDAPVVGVPLAAQSGQEKQPFSYILPVDAFTDVDVGDALTLSASGLPAWLAFDAATGTFSGTPPVGAAGDVVVSVTATDRAGAAAQQSLAIAVQPQPGNQAPVAGAPIGTQHAREWDAWAYSLPVGAFTDADVGAGDRLSYSATLANGAPLPYWLKVDAATGALSSAQVPQGYAGTLNVRVTATDLAGASAVQSVALEVAANRRLNMVSGTAGADIKFGSSGNDLLMGGKGNDILTGGLGNDSYRWSKGDGNDRLIELGGNDTIEFTDVNPGDVAISKTRLGDMQITVKPTGETITATLGLSSLLKVGWIEQLRFADGTVWDHAQMVRQSNLPRTASVSPLAAATSNSVDQLVQAMASFAPEGAASTSSSSLADSVNQQRNALLTSGFA